MQKTQSCFISFKSPIKDYALPEKFTFPFYYQPHPLCVLAAKELQQYLLSQAEWQHNFGLDNKDNDASGKMFGVLLVENEQQEIGYLTAFSGKLCDKYNIGKFVPSVPEIYVVGSETKEELNLQFNEQFKQEQLAINAITQKLVTKENEPKLHILSNQLLSLNEKYSNELTQHQAVMAANRKTRKEKRTSAEQQYNTQQSSDNNTPNINDEALALVFNTLAKESVHDKNQLKALKQHWQQKIELVQQQLTALENEIALLKSERQQRSSRLQNQLFQQYQLLNSLGETKALNEIFKYTPQQVPPSGAGDCAAPKLLQYAFKNNFKVLAMAEFWWGISPKSEIRQHKNYYPSCSGKCEPILNWMLDHIEQDENPLLVNSALNKTLEILYQDDVMAIVNKPNNLLSVPGKNIKDSVQTRIKQLIPSATGPIIVHRLDMSTSGVMVIALTKRSHKQLQKQFIARSVNKRYVALLEGQLPSSLTKGEITLPLTGDFYNRPRQLVCEKEGKPAHTTWELAENIKGKSKVYLSPKTGRTHQLRVHCAHSNGLHIPILGDDLYGNENKADRLYLHAERITLIHPINKKEMTFECPDNF